MIVVVIEILNLYNCQQVSQKKKLDNAIYFGYFLYTLFYFLASFMARMNSGETGGKSIS